MNTIRLTAIGAAVAGTLLLAGCATPVAGPGATTPAEPAPAETSPPPATPAPTGAPTMPPSEAPTEDPSDVSTWRITEDAIGPFELGMPWDDAVALADGLGWDLQYAQPDAGAGCAPFVTTPDSEGGGGIGIAIWDGQGSVADMTVGDDGDPDADGPRPTTAEGITVHSTLDEVRAAYPEAKEGSVPISTDRFFLGVDADADGDGISFEYRDGTTQVNSISVNAGGSPAYEHC